jgi:hypothetical protein
MAVRNNRVTERHTALDWRLQQQEDPWQNPR